MTFNELLIISKEILLGSTINSKERSGDDVHTGILQKGKQISCSSVTQNTITNKPIAIHYCNIALQFKFAVYLLAAREKTGQQLTAALATKLLYHKQLLYESNVKDWTAI